MTHTFVFDGKTSLQDFYAVTKISNDDDFEQKKGESETIAGFLLEQLGSFPKVNTVLFDSKMLFLPLKLSIENASNKLKCS